VKRSLALPVKRFAVERSLTLPVKRFAVNNGGAALYSERKRALNRERSDR